MNRVGNRLSALFKQNQPSFKSADGFPGGVCSNNVSSLIGLPRTADKAKPKTWPKRIPKHNPTYSNIINVVRIAMSLIRYDSVLLWMLSDVNGQPLLLGAAVVLIRVRSADRFESVVVFSRVRGWGRLCLHNMNMEEIWPQSLLVIACACLTFGLKMIQLNDVKRCKPTYLYVLVCVY